MIAKARRAKYHNEGLRLVVRRTLLQTRRSGHTQEAGQKDEERDASLETRFDEGEQVWLFMEKVKPGLKKKLSIRWHGLFRIKRRVEGFALELELPDRSGQRFCPVVHVSRLKKVRNLGERPTRRLVTGIDETERLDFDEELLLEES